jgi:MFS family permease
MSDSHSQEQSTQNAGSLVNLAVIIGVFFTGLGGGVAFPILPTLGDVLGIAPFMVGIILSINRATRVVLATPAGQILDRFGTRQPMLFGFFAQALAPFGYILGLNPQYLPISSEPIFLLARICWGIGTAFVAIGAFRFISVVTESDTRGKWIGYLRGSQSLGLPAGFVAGGLLADILGYAEAFFFAGTVNLLAAFITLLILPNTKSDEEDEEASTLRSLPKLFSSDTRILSIAGVNFVVRFLYSGVLLSTIVIYLTEFNIGLFTFTGVGTSGLVLALGAIAVSIATVASGRYSDRVQNRGYIAIPMLAMLALGFGLLGVVPEAISAFIAVILIGIGVGGSNPPLLAFLSEITAENDLGKIGGVYNMSGDLGSTVGPLVAIPAIEIIGFRYGYIACALLVILAQALVVGSLVRPVFLDSRADSNRAD